MCDIAKRNQNAAPIGEKLPRMPIGRRYDGLAEAVAVGQRPRRHLRFIQIRRDVDVAHRDVVEQRGDIDKLVEEHDMVGDAELPGAFDQALAIDSRPVP